MHVRVGKRKQAMHEGARVNSVSLACTADSNKMIFTAPVHLHRGRPRRRRAGEAAAAAAAAAAGAATAAAAAAQGVGHANNPVQVEERPQLRRPHDDTMLGQGLALAGLDLVDGVADAAQVCRRPVRSRVVVLMRPEVQVQQIRAQEPLRRRLQGRSHSAQRSASVTPGDERDSAREVLPRGCGSTPTQTYRHSSRLNGVPEEEKNTRACVCLRSAASRGQVVI